MSNSDLLQRLKNLRDDICLYVPEFEQERLLNIISVLYYGIQTISELEIKGLMLRTPYSYNEFQLSRIKSRTETGTQEVPEGCRAFLATVWTIAVGEPTPAGEIVASIISIYLAGVMMYEVVTCKKKSYNSYCLDKYVECQDKKPDWAKEHSGGYGYSMCQLCFNQCNREGYWICPVKFDKSMLGFEISINDDKPMTVATDSQAFVILSYGTSDCDMLVAGADDAFSYIWFDKIMQNGDKILIRIIDVGKDEVSSPFKIEKRNRERMKQTFEELKQELLNKQLL